MEYQLCFSTLACPNWGWDECLRRGPAFGYDGVEIRLLENNTNLLAYPGFDLPQRAQRRRELELCGFRVAGLASSVRFDSPESQEVARQLKTGEEYVDLAESLGAEFVRVFGDVLPDAPSAREAVLEQIACGLDRLGEYAAQRGIRILIETHGDFADTRLLADLLARTSSPAVGCVWDTHHPWKFFGEPIAETWQRLARWVKHTHWKDSAAAPPPAESDSDEAQAAFERAKALMGGHRPAHYALFGTGEFPARETLETLRHGGYRGWCSLEWEKAWHPELDGPEIALPQFVPAFRRLESA